MKDAATGFSPEGMFKRRLTDKVFNGLKCYEIIDGEITSMSIVTNPANEVKAKIISNEERNLAGVIIVPDKLIYRINPITGEEYYIYFTKEVIQILFEQYQEDVSWTQEDLTNLIHLFSDKNNSIDDIATSLKRSCISIERRIKKEGEPFRNLVLVTMASNGENLSEIAERLNLSIDELYKIVAQLGGKLIKK